jgi:ABC-type branched-subunit amino acid transport system permease subunit
VSTVRLAFEFLGFGWCTVRTPRAAFEIVQSTRRDNVGMTVDAAHFYGGGGLMSELDQLDPKRIYAFHLDDLEDTPKEAITDGTRLLPGLGVAPLNEICARLKGPFFILSTLAAAEVVRIAALNWSSLTGGPEGLSILPVPGWQRWGWAGCVAFVVAAQAIVGVLVYRFWRTVGASGVAHAGTRGGTLTR